MSWYARTGPRKKESGKFRSHALMGPTTSSGQQYRGWQFEFIAHQTGTGISRTRYAVSIRDPQQNRVEYLRDFSSRQQATQVAQQWVDRTLSASLTQPKSGIGTIPDLPAAPAIQEK